MRLPIAIWILMLAACFAAVPVISATLGGWYAYWGAVVLSTVWAAIMLWLKVTRYWESDD